MSDQKIVVLGGYGTFGSLIAGELSRSVNVIVAGRNKSIGQKFADTIKADFALCNAKDETSLRNTITGANMVINASGPFYSNDYSIPRICIGENCHYIDLADDREYVKNFPQLNDAAKEQKVFACTGASTSPAVTYALVRELNTNFQEAHSIKIYMTAGNKNEAGVSTFSSILSYAGTPVSVWDFGQWEKFMGWGLSEIFGFPPPVGRRFVQLCNVPDLELFPKLFKADQVVFKAGVELPIFNIGLSVLAQFKRLIPQINLPSFAETLVKISGLFKYFGSYAGCVLVKVQYKSGNRKSLAFVTSQNGPRIPASPAVLLARKILNDKTPAYGAYPCVGFISLGEFRNYLEPFGIKFNSIEA